MLRTATAVTYELDDIQAGTDELARITREKLELGASTFGLLLCDSDVEHDKFAAALSSKINAPVVGFSTTAFFGDICGLCDESAAILTILTSDDVQFSFAASGSITPENVCGQIEDTYKRAREALDGEPAVIMAFPPYILEIMFDIYARELGRASGGLPVFGGLPSHDEVNGRTAIYCGDTAAPDRLALLLISGNVKPVMNVEHSINLLANLKRTVTKSVGNVIYKVGDDTFVDFLRQFGLDLEKLSNPYEKTMSFTTYPLVLERGDGDVRDGGVIARTLHGIDIQAGTGTAIAEVPEGYTISVGVMQMRDMGISARENIRTLKERMKENEADGYKYSMIFAVSCMGRYFIMASQKTLESDALLSELPENLTMCGFYSFGEMCPTSVRNGTAANAAHNESLVLLAI